MFLILIISISGCSTSSEETSDIEEAETNEGTEESENNQTETNDTEDENDENEIVDEGTNTVETDEVNAEDQSSSAIPDLQLQVQKIDEEEGITIENNEIYSQLASVVEADPKAGIPNDFSVYPHDIIEYDDGSLSLLFLAVNRLHAPIKNISFDLTLGNTETGEYIFDQHRVELEETFMGILETDSTVPFMIDIYPEDEDLFIQLTNQTTDLRLENADVDLDE